MLAEPRGDLADHVNRKPDPIARYKHVAVGAFAVSGLLWLIVGGWALALSLPTPQPPGVSRAPAATPPALIGCMALAVATVLVGAVFWTAAGHREWVAGFAAMAESKLAGQDAKLDGLTELLGEHIEALRHYNALLEQRDHRPVGRPARRRRSRAPRALVDAGLEPEVLDNLRRLNVRLTGTH